MLAEPNFPARPDEFVGRRAQIAVFSQALQQAYRQAELVHLRSLVNGELARAACC